MLSISSRKESTYCVAVCWGIGVTLQCLTIQNEENNSIIFIFIAVQVEKVIATLNEAFDPHFKNKTSTAYKEKVMQLETEVL